jgi:hypothetical protein
MAIKNHLKGYNLSAVNNFKRNITEGLKMIEVKPSSTTVKTRNNTSAVV